MTRAFFAKRFLSHLRFLIAYFAVTVLTNFALGANPQGQDIGQAMAYARGYTLGLLNHASIKYYGLPLTAKLNKQYFSGKLTRNNLIKLEAGLFSDSSELAKNIEKIAISQKLAISSSQDVAEKIEEEVRVLFQLFEVQEILLKKYFTPENKTLLGKYFSLAKQSLIQGAVPHVLDLWNARTGFVSQIKSVRMIWPTNKDLIAAKKPFTLNGKKTWIVEAGLDSEGSFPSDLAVVMESGYEFYHSYGAQFVFTGTSTHPAFVIHPLFFNKIITADPSSQDFNAGLFLTMAHEMGHMLEVETQPSGPQESYNKFLQKNSEGLNKFKDEIFIPFHMCFAKMSPAEARKNYDNKMDEARADAIAAWALQYLITEFNLDKAEIINNSVAAFMRTLESISFDTTDSDSAHPSPAQRLRIFSGECSLENIPAYVPPKSDGMVSFSP